jgi:hypothetical protein
MQATWSEGGAQVRAPAALDDLKQPKEYSFAARGPHLRVSRSSDLQLPTTNQPTPTPQPSTTNHQTPQPSFAVDLALRAERRIVSAGWSAAAVSDLLATLDGGGGGSSGAATPRRVVAAA